MLYTGADILYAGAGFIYTCADISYTGAGEWPAFVFDGNKTVFKKMAGKTAWPEDRLVKTGSAEEGIEIIDMIEKLIRKNSG